MATVVHSVKVLALVNMHLSLDVVVNIMDCFPFLETLHIKVTTSALHHFCIVFM